MNRIYLKKGEYSWKVLDILQYYNTFGIISSTWMGTAPSGVTVIDAISFCAGFP